MKNHTAPIGTIEGFFGRAWTHEERLAHIDFLAEQSADFYIYAPKNDPFLRKRWTEQWPVDSYTQLHQLRDHCRAKNIQFGLGLSPFEVTELSDNELHHHFLTRMPQLLALKPDILGIFFDDMRGDTPKLAATQLQCVRLIQQLAPNAHIIFCPTYYSFDPVLERVFGSMPEHYWENLREGLDTSIDLFWTGERVCSKTYSREHLESVTALLGRKPFLWDNYPVNDGAIKSKHLHLSDVDASLRSIGSAIAGRAINPMNQAFLSQLAMRSSIAAHTGLSFVAPSENSQLELALHKDKILFETLGLDHIDQPTRDAKITCYTKWLPNPYAAEVIAWLNGEYTFDPACLTD